MNRGYIAVLALCPFSSAVLLLCRAREAWRRLRSMSAAHVALAASWHRCPTQNLSPEGFLFSGLASMTRLSVQAMDGALLGTGL